LLYESVIGTVPFDNPDPITVLGLQVTKNIGPPSERNLTLPPSVDRVILKALSKAPSDRFLSASAFREALAETLESLPRQILQSGSPSLEAKPPVNEVRGYAEQRTVVTTARGVPPAGIRSPALLAAGLFTLAIGLAWVGRLATRTDLPPPAPSATTSPAASALAALSPDLEEFNRRLSAVTRREQTEVWPHLYSVADGAKFDAEARRRLLHGLLPKVRADLADLKALVTEISGRHPADGEGSPTSPLLATASGFLFIAYSEESRLVQFDRLSFRETMPPKEDSATLTALGVPQLLYGPNECRFLADHLCRIPAALTYLCRRLPESEPEVVGLLATSIKVTRCFSVSLIEEKDKECYKRAVSDLLRRLDDSPDRLVNSVGWFLTDLWGWCGFVRPKPLAAAKLRREFAAHAARLSNLLPGRGPSIRRLIDLNFGPGDGPTAPSPSPAGSVHPR
jgi:hypothetical protein